MSRPTLEVADIVRTTGNSFWEQQQSHLAWPHRKVLDAMVRCRTAALGGHLESLEREAVLPLAITRPCQAEGRQGRVPPAGTPQKGHGGYPTVGKAAQKTRPAASLYQNPQS